MVLTSVVCDVPLFVFSPQADLLSHDKGLENLFQKYMIVMKTSGNEARVDHKAENKQVPAIQSKKMILLNQNVPIWCSRVLNKKTPVHLQSFL